MLFEISHKFIRLPAVKPAMSARLGSSARSPPTELLAGILFGEFQARGVRSSQLGKQQVRRYCGVPSR
ncbi:hypothetical protein J19TS2_40170 [Cohnella xylanilytica]|nr:hypothetical protein J19TS2_40170 [Cohnella xylanilytica]